MFNPTLIIVNVIHLWALSIVEPKANIMIHLNIHQSQGVGINVIYLFLK